MAATHETTTTRARGIDHSSCAPPAAMPAGHVGEFVMPGVGAGANVLVFGRFQNADGFASALA